MNSKNKAALVGGLLFGLTLIVTICRDLEAGNIKAIWTIWAGFSWNFFAYGFDRRMLPWQFVELKGGKEGSPRERAVWFWLTAVVYLAILATMAFADE